MKEVGCHLCNLARSLQSTVGVDPCNTTEGNIVVVVASCDTTYDIDHSLNDVILLQLLRASSMQHEYLVICCMARSCIPLPQSTIIVITSWDTTSLLVAVILAINSI
jgi:hypothetical protein